MYFKRTLYPFDGGDLIMITLDDAIQRAKNLESGTKFSVRELFEEYEWATLPKGVPLQFGKDFLYEVENGELRGIITAPGANTANHQQYIVN